MWKYSGEAMYIIIKNNLSGAESDSMLSYLRNPTPFMETKQATGGIKTAYCV
jgi:hypothetical protein